MGTKAKTTSTSWLIIGLALLFLLIAGAGLFLAGRYIEDNHLRSEEATATDLALLVKNNFSITDREVAYMKTLTFNEMEADPINHRLIDVASGVALNSSVSNIYLVAPLDENEYRYCPDSETAKNLGVETNTPLNGVWLLNGKLDENGYFVQAQREDIYRYTVLDENQIQGMRNQQPFGTFSSDTWGSFITGYVPVNTVEGNFVGLLGIDIALDRYQKNAQSMITITAILYVTTMMLMGTLFILIYLKYVKAKKNQEKLAFYSNMSHEMRTPMNGILGMTAISKEENNVDVLHHNMLEIENSGKQLLGLINQTLDYRGHKENASNLSASASGTSPTTLNKAFHKLNGKRILLCEDQPLNAKITKRMLQQVGCSVVIAPDGNEGVQRFIASKENYFDAILMDIRMPVMDGLQATRQIRVLQRKDAQTIPIIAITANSYQEDKEATKNAGMNAHLTKPIEPTLLFKTLVEKIFNQNTEDDKG